MDPIEALLCKDEAKVSSVETSSLNYLRRVWPWCVFRSLVFLVFLGVSTVHAFAVWWSFVNTSPDLWVMEVGGESASEFTANAALLILSFPLGWLAYLMAAHWTVIFLLLTMNSILWGFVITFLGSLIRKVVF